MSSTQERPVARFKIGAEQVDFTNLPALTIGDKKMLKSHPDYGVDFSKLRELGPDEEAKVVLFLARKMRPSTTMEEIDAMPINTGQRLLNHAVKVSAEVDADFLASSISSPTATAGGEKT